MNLLQKLYEIPSTQPNEQLTVHTRGKNIYIKKTDQVLRISQTALNSFGQITAAPVSRDVKL